MYNLRVTPVIYCHAELMYEAFGRKLRAFSTQGRY